MAYYLGERSKERAEGVHPKLIEVVELALSYGDIDFCVLKDGGVRLLELQTILYATGKSQTMNSHHLIKADGYGHAIDLAPLPIDWNNLEAFNRMAAAMFRAAAALGVQLEWGGFYKSWKDYPHFNLVGEA